MYSTHKHLLILAPLVTVIDCRIQSPFKVYNMAEGCFDLAYKKQKDSDLLPEKIIHKGTEDWVERNIIDKIHGSIQLYQTFPIYQCSEIERNIEQVISDVDKGKYKPCTVDRSRLRNKYFFGERYTYGDGLGQEVLFPIGEVDPIPLWITRLVISPLEVAGILPLGFTNSAVINLYLPGGCIVSHVDPPHIFDRPIVSVSFLSDCVLSFGCKFTYKPIRATPPVTTVPLRRGSVLSMSGFAADGITHCIRPQDVKARRAAIILRRVLPDAPRMSWSNYSFVTGVLRGFSTIYRMPRKRSWEECEKQLPVWTRKRARFDIKQYHGN